MNLIFIYGPPAAGKLTVASRLSQLLGYKLLDNHRAIDYLAELFPRGNDIKIERTRSQLGRTIRLAIFEGAAQADVNLITTFAPLSPGTLDFTRDVRNAIEKHGGTFMPVQLLPSQEALLARVTSESRIGKKLDNEDRWQQVVGDNPLAFETFPDMEHLVLDNTKLSAEEAAQKVIAYYSLAS